MNLYDAIWFMGFVLICGLGLVLSWCVDLGPYGLAYFRIPLLCRASKAPQRPDQVPVWAEKLITAPSNPSDPRTLEVCVLPDLLGGAVEIACIRGRGIGSLAVRCPRVRPPRDLTRGTIVAGDPFLLPGKRELDELIATPLQRSKGLKITIFLRRGTGVPYQPDDRAQLAISHAFDRGFWCGLSSVEVHNSEVYLVFDNFGRFQLRPRHIAAICEALDAGVSSG